MKIKLLLIIFALFGSQLGFAQEIKAVAVDSAETVAMDLTKQKIADKEALKEKKIADKASTIRLERNVNKDSENYGQYEHRFLRLYYKNK